MSVGEVTPPTVVLVGLMGTGKSTVARKLGERLGRPVIDTDRAVEATEGRSVREIFASSGEDAFREMESRALEVALDGGSAVVAAAGGIVLRRSNRELLVAARRRGLAIVVWLRADTNSLVARTSRGAHRPLLDGDPAGTLSRLADERGALYAEVADAVVDTDDLDVDAVADAVLGVLGGADSP